MWCRFWRVSQPLLTLAAVACCVWLVWKDQQRPTPEQQRRDLERHSSRADIPVRNFLEIKWLGGDYELPESDTHCVVAALQFGDGKFRGRYQATVFSPKPGESRVVPFYVMWGPGPKGTRVVSGWPGIWSGAHRSEFFAKIDGGLVRVYGDKSTDEIRGYRVAGFAASRKTRPGIDADIGFGDLNHAIETREAVVVLGVKPFPTQQEAERWLFENNEPGDP